jgi:hypothetical protein
MYFYFELKELRDYLLIKGSEPEAAESAEIVADPGNLSRSIIHVN